MRHAVLSDSSVECHVDRGKFVYMSFTEATFSAVYRALLTKATIYQAYNFGASLSTTFS